MKKRLDIRLVELGLVDNRTQAQGVIMAGLVSNEGRRLDKPGIMVDETADLHVKDRPKFVSRAGGKLESVAETLGIDFRGKVVLDVGSSTGGFTDFALQNGATKVYAVDVGTGQMAYKLRNDKRVVLMEQTDIREAVLPQKVDIAVIDVSFISIKQILTSVGEKVKPDGIIFAMAKPQFEVGKAVADKYRGVIPVGPERDKVLSDLREWFGHEFEVVGEADSGVAGANGNLEHFFALRSRLRSEGLFE